MTADPLSTTARPWQEVAGEQDGVLSRRQALRGGLTEDGWQWRLDTGRWQSVLPGVAVLHSGTVTDPQRGVAAVLYAGPGACLSGDTALVLQGLRHLAVPVVHVAVPEGRAVRRRAFGAGGDVRAADCRNGRAQVWQPASPGRAGDGAARGERPRLEAHQVRRLPMLVHPVRRPPVVRVAPAVLHAVAWASSDRAAEWRLAAVVQQRLVSPGVVRQALVGMPRLHRHALVRAVLDDVELGAHAASELDFLRFLRLHRLPAPDRLQRPVRHGRMRYLDAWWERQRVTVELDGAHHRMVGTWEDDALRANDVVVAERHDRIVLLRFTTGNLRHDGVRVAAQLQAVLS